MFSHENSTGIEIIMSQNNEPDPRNSSGIPEKTELNNQLKYRQYTFYNVKKNITTKPVMAQERFIFKI